MSIRSGRLILTLMPSLACGLNCPHCYLTPAQRRSKETLTVTQVARFARDLSDLWSGLKGKTRLDVYWYGGEPLTNLTPPLFDEMASLLSPVAAETRHVVLSSLVGVDINAWAATLHKWAGSAIQTSWDGAMRGDRHLRHQEREIARARQLGLAVDTLTVVNRGLIDMGARAALDWLIGQGIRASGWLPMQRNTRNIETGAYSQLAPSMNEFSEFMIALTELARAAPSAPVIGEECFIASMRGNPLANKGLQTLFLMPNGDLTLPDYHDDGTEFLLRFGNIEDGLSRVLAGTTYRAWCRKQVALNNNPECRSCDISDCCLMEFWKPNPPADDCMGGAKFVRHILQNRHVRALPVAQFS